jgi:hypothetical protein
MDMNISLDVLKKYRACNSGIECFKYLKTTTVHETINKCMDLSDDVVLQWTNAVLDKYKWCNWLLSRILPEDEKIKYAICSARLVIDIFEEKYPSDNRPRKAIEAAELYLEGKATIEQIRDAAYAAYATYAAANAAYAANAAAYAAADTAAYAAVAADRKEIFKSIITYGLTLIEESEVVE